MDYNKIIANNCRAQEVGQKAANELGLYDITGNVWEWCSDWYEKDYYSKNQSNKNPIGPSNRDYRVLRGGSWFNFAWVCRLARRDYKRPLHKSDNCGFRIVYLP